MALTNFPDGITTSDGDSVAPYATASGSKTAAGTVIVTGGSIDVASGLTTVSFVVASPYGELIAGTAGAFSSVSAAGGVSGTVTIHAIDPEGTASVSSGTATWWAVGT